MSGGATQSPLKLGRAGAARTARSDTGFFWNEAGVGGREKEIERRAALGQRRQSGGDNSHDRVADLGDEMREFALPQHFAQTAARSCWNSRVPRQASDAADERKGGGARPRAPRRTPPPVGRRRRGPQPCLPFGRLPPRPPAADWRGPETPRRTGWADADRDRSCVRWRLSSRP